MRLHLEPHTTTRFTITASALETLPLVRTAEWIRGRLGAGGFTSSRIERVETTCGWPAVAAYGAVAGVPTLRVYFQFTDLGALAEARAVDDAGLAAAWTVLASARPDYTGEIAAIAQLC